jgi:hypothetical protein
VDRSFEPLWRELFGQVQEGAGGRRDRDAAMRGDLVVAQCDVVSVDPGTAAERRSTVISTWVWRSSQVPHRAAADRWLSTAPGPRREHRRNPAALAGQHAMTDRVDAAMDHVQ